MFNLLSIEEKQKFRAEYRKLVLSVFLPMLAFVLFIAVVTLVPSVILSYTHYSAMLSESKSDEVLVKKTQELEMKNAVTDANSKILMLRGTEKARSVSLYFDRILADLPKGVHITGLLYDKNIPSNRRNPVAEKSTGLITVSGHAHKRADLLAFKSELEKEKSFSKIDLPVASLVSESDLTYNITITVAE